MLAARHDHDDGTFIFTFFVLLFLKGLFCARSYQILKLFKKKKEGRGILPIDETLTINYVRKGYEGVLHSLQILNSGASPSDAVLCHNHATIILRGLSLSKG